MTAIGIALLVACALLFVGLAIWESRDGRAPDERPVDIDRFTRAERARRGRQKEDSA